jgi:hypothetical protein
MSLLVGIDDDMIKAIERIDSRLNKIVKDHNDILDEMYIAKMELREIHDVFHRQKLRAISEKRFTTITTGEMK